MFNMRLNSIYDLDLNRNCHGNSLFVRGAFKMCQDKKAVVEESRQQMMKQYCSEQPKQK